MIFQLIKIISLVFFFATTSSAVIAASRNVTINVTVLQPNGSPVVGVGIRGFSTEESASGLTNAAGLATIGIKVSDSSELVRIRIWPDVPEISKTNSERMSIADTYVSIIESGYYAYEYVVATPAPANSFNLSVTGQAAVTVTGRAVSSATPPVPTKVIVQTIGGSLLIKQMIRDEYFVPEFETKSVLKSTRSFLLLSPERSSEQKLIRLNALQTASNLNLGDVILPDPALGKPVNIQVDNRDHPMLKARKDMASELTVLSTDGQRVYMLIVRASGNVVAGDGSANLPKITPGSYYLIPGSINDEPAIRALYAIDNGTNMTPASLPALSVPASGDPTPVTVDATQVINNIIAHLPIAP